MTEIPTGYATEAWVTENFSKASATYKPTAIERYGSLSGTSIPVQALNESGSVLLTGTVDAGDVYNSGFNKGYSSGYTAGQQSIDTGAYYDEGYSAGYSYGYDRGEASVTLTASGWSGSENVITASNGATMTVKKHYSSKTTVSSGDTVFVSYNGAMVYATYRSGGSSFSYISSVTVS